MKNHLKRLIVAAMLFAPQSMLEIAAAITGLVGEGTESSPFLISSLNDLISMRTAVNEGNTTSGDIFLLTNDVDISSETYWLGIGTKENRFNGVFDGNGKAITVNIDTKGKSGYCFFNYIGASGIIKNLTVKGNMKDWNAAGIASYNYGTILHCTSYVNITETRYSGGITTNNLGTIKYCRNYGIISGAGYLGGITASSQGKEYYSANYGDVIGNSSYCAGIVGYSQTGAINFCCNLGNITGNLYVGGIAGLIGNNAKNSYSVGSIATVKYYSNEPKHYGALIGYLSGQSSNLCYTSDMDPYGDNHATDGSVKMSEEELKTKFSLGDGELIWHYSTTDYPEIRLIDYNDYVISAGNGNDGNYYSTFYSSDVDFVADDNTSVYTAKATGSKMQLANVEDNYIPAGNAVILISNNNSITLSPKDPAGGTLENNDLSGTDPTISVANKTVYTLGLEHTDRVIGFWRYNGDAIHSNKAYYAGDSSSAKISGFLFEEMTTRIKTVDAKPMDTNIYNLRGLRVNKMMRGIYIQNGKKYIK